MKYEKPDIEIMLSESDDVVRTSNTTPPTYGGWSGDNDESDFE